MKILTKRRSLLAILFLAALAAIAYLGKSTQFGFFSDDWYLLYGGVNYGAAQFWDIFIIDRPLRGILYFILYSVLKTNVGAYFYLSVLVRLAGALGLFLTLQLIWKERRAFCTVAATLFLVYPGFLEQPNGMDYMALQLTVVAMIFSLYLSIKYLEAKRTAKLIYFVLASGLAFTSYLFMEYYVGAEAYRFLFLGFILWPASGSLVTKAKRVLWQLCPFLVAPIAFVFWRLFFFTSQRSNTSTAFLYESLSASWLQSFAEIARRFIVDASEVALGAFVTPLAYMAARINATEFLIAVLLGLVSVALLLFYLKTEEPDALPDQPKTRKDMLTFALLGLAAALLCLVPINLAQREVTFPFFSRFSLASSVGVAIFLAGMASLQANRKLRTAMLATLLFLSVSIQYANNVRFSMEWTETQRFWQNMIWRAPDLQDGTTLTGFRTAPIYEGYFIWSPANLIYREPSDSTISLSAEVLNRDILRNIMLKAPYEKDQRSMIIRHDYNKLLLFSMPTTSSCLRLIDAAQIELSIYDDPLIALAAPYSSTANIMEADAIQYEMFTEILRTSPVEENWCYFYQQAALARQFGDWEQVAALAEAARAGGYAPYDPIEWMPFIQAFAYLGNEARAGELIALMSADPFYKLQACTIFEGKQASGNEAVDAGNLFLAAQFCSE